MTIRKFWLLKTEPGDFSWDDMVSRRITEWDGVLNPQAQKFLKAANIGDLAFFYHTGKEKTIKGIVKIIKEFYLNGKYGSVDVEYHSTLKRDISLKELKSSLSDMVIFRQPRLSVAPITLEEWDYIISMSNRPQ